MTYILVVVMWAGAVQINAQAGPFELADCEAAAVKTRRYARLFVDRVDVRCTIPADLSTGAK